jgi:signal transduction histidine kinase
MKRRSVLVVDDDRDILEVLTMRLDSIGYETVAVADPERALALLAERAFDVALVDLRMEPLDGIAFTRAAHERQSRLPVLIMTAHGTIENAVHAIKDGASDFITKPFVGDEVARKLSRALLERRWARDRTLLRTVGETLAHSSVVDRLLEAIVVRTLEATETERAILFLAKDGSPVATATAGVSQTPETPLVAAAETAMRERRPVVTSRSDERVILAAPLLVDGASGGALVAENPSYVVPTEDDLVLLAIFAAQAAVALKNAHEQSRLRSGALAALGRVATQVAHELNNPLGGLKLYAHLVAERFRKASDEQGVELARKIDQAVTHLAELVTDITAYGRPPELDRQPIALNALVEECIGLAQDRIAQHGVRLVLELDPAVGTQQIDAREMRKALLNLLLNAVEAMPDGGTLGIRTRRAGDLVTLVIEDSGCGMDDETRARMFDLFFTTKPNGTGLGMAITRSVVDRHGGRLSIDSTPGRGTRVRIELPAS